MPPSDATNGMPHSPSITGVDEFGTVADKEAKSTASSLSPFAGQSYTNVTSSSRGACVLFATDEWFAPADNLLKDEPPTFDPDLYCEQGKVMDGWESRRRREAGHDWCILKLSQRANVFGIEIDTAFFTGNHVPAISLQIADLSCEEESSMVRKFPGAIDRLLHGCVQGTGASPQEVSQAEAVCREMGCWKELLPKTPLSPGYEESRMHFFSVEKPVSGTHLRVNYFPDGGIARLRLWGDELDPVIRKPGPAYSPIKTGRTCSVVSHAKGEQYLPSRLPYPDPELSADVNGGVGHSCSNKHYGDPWHLIQSSLGEDMGDGWETARHPERPSVLVSDPTTGLVDSHLSDWCVLQLGSVAGNGVTRVILDTKDFRGNYPESVEVEGCLAPLIQGERVLSVSEDPKVEWFPLVPRGRMAPDSEHCYEANKGQILNASRPVSHVRVSIFPDGGISRVRVYGPAGELDSL